MFSEKDGIFILSYKDRQFSKFIKYIQNVGYKLCLEQIGQNYIMDSLKTCTHIVVVGTQMNRMLRSNAKSLDFSKVR